MWIRLLMVIVLLSACTKKQALPPTTVAEPPTAASDVGAVARLDTDGPDLSTAANSSDAVPAVEPAAPRPPTSTIAPRCEISCFTHGQCGLGPDGENCVATSRADCLASTGCEEYGFCALENGRCVEDCSRMTRATLEETELAGQGDCVRTAETPCSDTDACKIAGYCLDVGETHCGWSPDCSIPCNKEGACAQNVWRGCFVVSDADCEKSEACKNEDRCAATAEGSCVTREQADSACPSGKISVDGSCHFPVSYKCSKECKDHNRCEALVSNTRHDGEKSSRPFVECVETDVYCASRPDCAEKGICGAVKEEWYSYNKCWREPCGAPTWGGCKKTADGCAKSKRCKLDGSCYDESTSMYCRPTVSAHCEQSIDCKRLGNCGLVRISGYHECGATEQAHCEQSDDCKKNGLCAFWRGDCVTPPAD